MPDGIKSITPPGLSASPDPSIHQAVVDLCIARRTLLIYPASHDQVKSSLRRAYQSLSAVLELESTITLMVLKEDLGVNNRILDAKSAAFSDLAVVLKQYQIAALTIARGLEFKEFVRFLRLMTTERDKIMERGGVSAVAGESRFNHITLREVDYSRLQMTEESEIQRSSRRHSDGSLWQAFVTDLMSGKDDASPGGKSPSGSIPEPRKLADLLNRRMMQPDKAVDHYERAMAEAAGGRPDGSPGMFQALPLFQKMIKGLNPALQKQFLASTFDRCAQVPDIADATWLIDGLGADLIVRMLQQANLDGKRISPSLVAFINKVGYLTAAGDFGGTGGGAVPGSSHGLTSSKVESLLAHEQYDTYVDANYGRLLSHLTVQQPAAVRAPEVAPWARDMAAGLSDAGIHMHAARAMTRMMAASPDAAGYRDWARQLAYLLDDLLAIRAFDFLIELMDFVRTEKAGREPQRSEIAGLLLNRFSDPPFVAKAIQTVRDSGRTPPPDGLRFLTALGEPVVLEIFDSMEPAQRLEQEGDLFTILKCLSSLAIREALERINDPCPENIIQMVRIIRSMGDGESAQQVRSLLDHGSPEVRMEALATLLKFNNKWGLIRLRDLVAQPAEIDFKPALELAGAYGVREVVPQLLLYLKQRGDPELREVILQVLGRIGDSRAIPAITRFAQRRWGISKKQIDRLKQVIYSTLGGYPFGEIRHLLHLGLKQKDENIQAVCRKLLREGTREGAADS